MRSVPFAPAAALLAAILVAVPPSVLAAGPQDHPSTSVISGVGTRTDLPLPPVKGPPAFPPAGQRASTWRALDGKAFEQAKAAANAAAQGGGPSLYKNDFSLSASPSSQTVVQGSSTSYAVTVGITSGRSQTVRFSVSGLPLGATGTFTATSVTGSGTSTLRVTTATTTPVGSSNLTITARGTNATHTTTVTLVVIPPPDFTISASPATLSIVQGAFATSSISTTQVGSAGTVGLSALVSPGSSGVTASVSPTSVAAGVGSTLTVTVSSSATIQSYTVTVTGIEGSATHSTTVAVTVTATPPGGPTASPSWNGEYQGGLAPPDPTGAIGPNSYIELINLRYGIYGRDGNLLPSSGSEGDFTTLMGLPVSELSDPQLLWDPGAQRFYYTALDVARYGFAFGYSKSASPQSGADFCKYILDYGYGSTATLPDYPKLGVTKDFVLIGSNDFLLESIYNGSNVNWLAKPTDPSCPGTIGPGGTFASLKNAGGSLMSTPVPAFSADPSGTGYVVGSVDVGTGSGSVLSVFKVTKNASTGSPVMSGPYSVSLPLAYSVPADAPQQGVTAVLDTMDTRLTHAVAAFDPNLGATGATAVWTAHTVYGGAGAEDRWYEINVGGTPSLAQWGRITDKSLYVWNGAISPNRANDGTNGSFGGDMVMGFNTSSSATFPAIQMVSKKGSGLQSPWVLIEQSTGPNVDFTCGPTCRWGDYSGATPDPLASAGGQVWLSGEWNVPESDGSTPVWRTWNWAAQP